jgi:hypothetical protein
MELAAIDMNTNIRNFFLKHRVGYRLEIHQQLCYVLGAHFDIPPLKPNCSRYPRMGGRGFCLGS